MKIKSYDLCLATSWLHGLIYTKELFFNQWQFKMHENIHTFTGDHTVIHYIACIYRFTCICGMRQCQCPQRQLCNNFNFLIHSQWHVVVYLINGCEIDFIIIALLNKSYTKELSFLINSSLKCMKRSTHSQDIGYSYVDAEERFMWHTTMPMTMTSTLQQF
jgi:hypothetical protein